MGDLRGDGRAQGCCGAVVGERFQGREVGQELRGGWLVGSGERGEREVRGIKGGGGRTASKVGSMVLWADHDEESSTGIVGCAVLCGFGCGSSYVVYRGDVGVLVVALACIYTRVVLYPPEEDLTASVADAPALSVIGLAHGRRLLERVGLGWVLGDGVSLRRLLCKREGATAGGSLRIAWKDVTRCPDMCSVVKCSVSRELWCRWWLLLFVR